jgi:phosphatidate cytidylyltransferase
LKQRIVTGIVGGIAFLSLVYLGEEWYSLLVLLLAVAGLYEFYRMAGIKPFGVAGLLGYLLMISLLLPHLVLGIGQVPTADLLLPVLLLLFYPVLQKNQFHIEHVALTVIGALYIGYGFAYMAETRYIPNDGLILTLLVILGIWATDSGAYFIGKTWGRRKLWPSISPNKTVEGAIGGLLVTVLIVLAVNAWIGSLTAAQALLIALVTGIAGQMGDLVESAIKRHFGVKDSGRLLPGHGGVLDRFDSLLFVFPVLHLLGVI